MAAKNGNKEVVDLLKYWLKEARKGELRQAAIAASAGGDDVGIAYAGDMGFAPQVVTGLGVLGKELEHIHRNRHCGERDRSLDAGYHEYNLATDAQNWDFLIWLIDAEMTRIREGGTPPLKVWFTHVEDLDDKRRRFFENVYKPLLPLIGAVEDPRAIGGRRSAALTLYQICLAARKGEKVPLLAASEDSLRNARHKLNGRKPVTITLREAEHWPKRNSNMLAWMTFARDLQRKGEDVIFVRDTARANESLFDFETWPQASFRVAQRMALYAEAKINLFVSNGPAGLAVFGDRPYLYFVPLSRDDQYEANNPEWWLMAEGMAEGEQYPWARPDQRIVWKRDDYMNIAEAWEQRGG